MKRSNRIVLLLGVVLAALAFAGVFYVINQRAAPVSTAPTELPTVYARQNIALGTVITSDMVEARPQAISVRDPNAYGDVGQVVGKTARAEIKKDQIILSDGLHRRCGRQRPGRRPSARTRASGHLRARGPGDRRRHAHQRR